MTRIQKERFASVQEYEMVGESSQMNCPPGQYIKWLDSHIALSPGLFQPSFLEQAIIKLLPELFSEPQKINMCMSLLSQPAAQDALFPLTIKIHSSIIFSF